MSSILTAGSLSGADRGRTICSSSNPCPWLTCRAHYPSLRRSQLRLNRGMCISNKNSNTSMFPMELNLQVLSRRLSQSKFSLLNSMPLAASRLRLSHSNQLNLKRLLNKPWLTRNKLPQLRSLPDHLVESLLRKLPIIIMKKRSSAQLSSARSPKTSFLRLMLVLSHKT